MVAVQIAEPLMFIDVILVVFSESLSGLSNDYIYFDNTTLLTITHFNEEK